MPTAQVVTEAILAALGQMLPARQVASSGTGSSGISICFSPQAAQRNTDSEGAPRPRPRGPSFFSRGPWRPGREW